MDARIRQRRRAIQQAAARRRRRIATSVFGALLLAGAAFALSYSPLFQVEHVRVSGARDVRADEVRRVAGVEAGDRLLSVDLDRVQQRVAGLAWVGAVDVSRLPPSTVEVRVTPRVPVATVVIGGVQWQVDVDAIVVAGGAADGTVVIDAPNSVLPPPGEVISGAAVVNALSAHLGLPPHLQAAVMRYEAPSVRGLRLVMEADAEGQEPIIVRFGDADRAELKGQVITALLEQAREQRLAGEGGSDLGIAEIDVRAPDNPVLIPRP